jgi:hypothetical protein
MENERKGEKMTGERLGMKYDLFLNQDVSFFPPFTRLKKSYFLLGKKYKSESNE